MGPQKFDTKFKAFAVLLSGVCVIITIGGFLVSASPTSRQGSWGWRRMGTRNDPSFIFSVAVSNLGGEWLVEQLGPVAVKVPRK